MEEILHHVVSAKYNRYQDFLLSQTCDRISEKLLLLSVCSSNVCIFQYIFAAQNGHCKSMTRERISNQDYERLLTGMHKP